MKSKGILFAFLSGICFGMIPLVVLSVSRGGGVPSSFVLMVRMYLGAAFLSVLAIPRLKKNPIPKEMVLKLIIASALNSMTAVLLYESFETVPSGVGLILHYTHPMLMMIVNAFFFGVRFNKQVVMALLLSLVGVIALCDAAMLGENAWIGLTLATLSSVTFSATLLFVEHAKISSVDPFVYTWCMMLGNGTFILLYNLVSGNIHAHVTPATIPFFAAAGFFATSAVLLQFLGIKDIGSVLTTILGTMEPITCTIGSALVLGEHLTARMIAGTVFVLAAVIIVSLYGGKSEAPKVEKR